MTAALVGLVGQGAAQVGDSVEQANIARGRAADSARLEGAADAFDAVQANIARGRAADAAQHPRS